MSDVSKVSGENRPDPKGPKKRKDRDSEAFREMMKVGKVRETDPEEKRERKRQAEQEEELRGQQETQTPHQGLGAEGPQTQPPFEGGSGTSPSMEGSSGGSVSGPDVSPADESLPEYPHERPQTQQQPQQQQQSQRKKKRVEGKKEVSPAKKKPHLAEGKKSTKKAKPEQAGKAPDTHAPPPLTKKEKEAIEKTKKEAVPPFEGEIPTAPVKKKEEKLPKETEAPEEVTAPPPKVPPLPEGAWEATTDSTKEEKVTKKGEKELNIPLTPDEAASIQQQPITTGAPTPTPPVAPLSAPFANLPGPVQQLFERMVGVITVMNTQGVQETTISLDNPQFAKSVFYGAQIIITEFSTAPKAYNIELRGNQQAVNMMNANAEELVAAFQAGNYNFKVNRIDAGFLPISKEIKRKEASRVKRKKTGGG